MNILVGLTGDYLPFSIFSNKNFKGFDVELIQSFATAKNHTLEFVKTEWPRFERDLEEGKFDIAGGGISVTKERLERFIVSSPINIDGKVILTHKDFAERFFSLETLDQVGVRVIYNPGGTNERFVSNNIQQAEKICEVSIERIFQRLRQKDVHVMITDLLEALHQESTSNGELVAVGIDHPLEKSYMAFMSTTKNAPIIMELNDWLSTEYGYTMVNKLRHKYFPPEALLQIEKLTKSFVPKN